MYLVLRFYGWSQIFLHEVNFKFCPPASQANLGERIQLCMMVLECKRLLLTYTLVTQYTSQTVVGVSRLCRMTVAVIWVYDCRVNWGRINPAVWKFNAQCDMKTIFTALLASSGPSRKASVYSYQYQYRGSALSFLLQLSPAPYSHTLCQRICDSVCLWELWPQ